MIKLHAILALEGGLSATATKIVDEAKDTFAKRLEHFVEQHRVLTMFDENDQNQNVEDHKALVTTVPDKLDYVATTVSRFFDICLQKESANQQASADLVVNGAIVATAVPATMLLGLETKLNGLREMYGMIPTLAPGRDWQPDAGRGRAIYRDKNQEVQMKTAKTIRFKVMVEPTNHHPAQIEKWFEDVPVGRIARTTWSSAVTPAEKSDMLERLDSLIRDVKRARQKANDTEIAELKIGAALFRYVNHGVLPTTGTAP